MNEPRRLLEGEGTELERALLQAGLEERPRGRGRRQALVALAAATGVSAFTKWTWAGADLLRLGMAHAGKVVAGTVIVGSTTFAVVHASSNDSEGTATVEVGGSKARVVARRGAQVPPPEEAEALSVEELPPLETADAENAASDVKAPARAPAAPSIADEIKALDRARQSLASGNPGRALQQLNDYARLYRGGRLGQEAMLIRIEALARSGRHAQARAMAERFREANPRSPYTKRLESIVGKL